MTLADVEDEQPSKGLAGWSDERTELLYSNSMALTGGPFDVTLIFGQQDNASRNEANPAPTTLEVVRIAMSWGHLKSMIPLMAKVVAEYEQQVGEVPAPGFDQNWKS